MSRVFCRACGWHAPQAFAASFLAAAAWLADHRLSCLMFSSPAPTGEAPTPVAADSSAIPPALAVATGMTSPAAGRAVRPPASLRPLPAAGEHHQESA